MNCKCPYGDSDVGPLCDYCEGQIQGLIEDTGMSRDDAETSYLHWKLSSGPCPCADPRRCPNQHDDFVPLADVASALRRGRGAS